LLLCFATNDAAMAQILPAFGRDRAGTSGFQFLKVPVDARSAALGQTVVANASDATALFWNPAMASQGGSFQIGLGHAAYYSDIMLDYVAAIKTFGDYSIGISVQTLNSGDMEVTTEFQPFGTGETFRFYDISAGITLAQRLTDLFSYGVTARYVEESSAGVSAKTAMFDLGFFYRVGTTGLQMAVAIRNFGLDADPSGNLSRTTISGETIETSFEALMPPTSFLLGASYTLLQNNPMNTLVISGQLNNPNDNAESFNIGVEYGWNEILLLRAGYRFGVEEVQIPGIGFGLIIPGIGPTVRFDYGLSSMTRLGTVHRAGLNIEL